MKVNKISILRIRCTFYA